MITNRLPSKTFQPAAESHDAGGFVMMSVPWLAPCQVTWMALAHQVALDAAQQRVAASPAQLAAPFN